MKRGAHGSRGQSLVELALVLPILMIVVLGAIDFGRAYFAYVSVTNGARNGAHYASANSDNAANLVGIRGAVIGDTGELVNTSGTNPQVTAETGIDGQGHKYVDVTVTYEFDTIFPWPGLPGSFDIEREVRARVAR